MEKHPFKSSSKWLFILLFTGLLSCELVVDVDLPPFEPSLVVNGFLAEDSAVTVLVTQNQFVLDNTSLKFIDDAEVTLLANDEVVTTLERIDLGLYSSNVYPTPGVPYELRVAHPQYTTATGQTMIPTDLPVVSKIEFDETFDEFGFEEQEVTITIDDAPGDHYYEIVLWSTEYGFEFSESGDTIIGFQQFEQRIYIYSEDVIFDEFDGWNDVWVFTDDLFDGNEQSISFTYSFFTDYSWVEDFILSEDLDFRPNNGVRVEVRSVSSEYYQYQRTSAVQSYNEGNPFAEPVQVFNNIENGFGVFAGYRSLLTD